ncbi:MAG TPA: cytochrome c biogenesis protein CcdA [Tepidiformaceae bacterium]|nr:cytochrome c biogenesis protein CcdA [Tepidiformaceae bacterium]
MAATRTASRPLLTRQGVYILLAVLAAVPVILFALGPVNSGDISLKGPGGPLLAFSAGLLSFASPCVLPLVPVYIAHISGSSFENGRLVADRRVTFSHALVFVLAFSLVFVLLGTAAGLLGTYFFRDNQRELEKYSGILLVAMGVLLIPAHGRRDPLRSALLLIGLTGLYFALVDLAELRDDRDRVLLLAGVLALVWLRFAGYLQLSLFSRTMEVRLGESREVSYVRTGLIGTGWALGWTPCMGPVLGSILALAGSGGDALQGTYLLTAYSAGLAVPFLITGLALSDAQGFLRRLQKHSGTIELVSGLLLIAVGTLLITGRLTALNDYFTWAGSSEGL